MEHSVCICHPLIAVEVPSHICTAATDVDVQASESTTHRVVNSDASVKHCMTLMLVVAQEAGASPHLALTGMRFNQQLIIRAV